MRVEGKGRARKPYRLGGQQGFQRLHRFLVDRGAPIRGLAGAAALDLGNGILARELGVSERSIRTWLARLRADGMLSTWVHARKVAGAWGGQVRVLVVHNPGMGPQAKLWGRTARVRARGHWRDLQVFRLIEAADVPVSIPAAASRMEGALKRRRRFRTASPESPYGAPGEIEAPRPPRQSSAAPAPKLRPEAIRAARRRLWAYGLRGDGLDAVSGYVQRALEAFPADRERILDGLEALERRARGSRCGPARYILTALRRGWAPWDEPSGCRPPLPALTPDLAAAARCGIPDPISAPTPKAERRELFAWLRSELHALGMHPGGVASACGLVGRKGGTAPATALGLRSQLEAALAEARPKADPAGYFLAALRAGRVFAARPEYLRAPVDPDQAREDYLAQARIARLRALDALAPPTPPEPEFEPEPETPRPTREELLASMAHLLA